MTQDDDLPAQVRRQDEETELQIAAQLAELRTDTEAAHEDDLPAQVRRQDEETERQVAAQLAELRKDEDVMAARRRWSDLSEQPADCSSPQPLPTAPSGLRRSSTSSADRQARSGAGNGCGPQPWQ